MSLSVRMMSRSGYSLYAYQGSKIMSYIDACIRADSRVALNKLLPSKQDNDKNRAIRNRYIESNGGSSGTCINSASSSS